MKNEININSDGINVYVIMEIRIHNGLKVVLVGVTITVIVLLVFLLSMLDVKEEPKLIFPMVTIPLLVFYFLVRYTLWNLFGKENLIINTKSISSNFEYGWYKTNLKTILIDRLGFGQEFVREFELVKYGNLNLYNYDKLTHLPEVIYSTSIELTLDEIKEIENKISEIFIDEFREVNKFTPFSEN
ncbi:MAG: hypothetical protein JKY44_05260 [Flavobacteriaceae bacterium]|nr:hypothetical protein [Flavobacteriaceae bacterium]